MNPWWLLLIVPATGFFSFVVGVLLVELAIIVTLRNRK